MFPRCSFLPAGELAVCHPFGEPDGKIAPYLREVAPVVHPSELEQAIVIDLPGDIVEGLAQEVRIGGVGFRAVHNQSRHGLASNPRHGAIWNKHKESGCQPLEVDGGGCQVGPDLHVWQATSYGGRQSVPGLASPWKTSELQRWRC